MKRIVFSFVFILFSLASFSQGVVRDFDVKDFDTVHFVLQSINPELQEAYQIRIFEDGVPVKGPIKLQPLEKQLDPKLKRNVLFLLDLRSNPIIQELLGDFFDRTAINDSLLVDVVAFGRNEDGEILYQSLMPISFSSDLSAASVAAKHISDSFQMDYWADWSLSSDILWALNQAIGQMKTLPVDEAKAIVLYTDGRNNTDTGSEIMSLVAEAKNNRIQVYTVTIEGDEAGRHLCEDVSTRTYGMNLFLDNVKQSYERKDDAASGNSYMFSENMVISSWISNLSKRWNGITYNVTFKSHFKRIGQQKPIEIRIGDDSIVSNYSVPKYTFGIWVKEHIWLFLILLILAIGAFGTGLFFLIRYLRDVSADKKEERDRLEAERQRMKSEQESLLRRVEIAENEQRRKQEREKSKEEAKKRQEYLDAINAMMQSKNIKAHLLVSAMKGSSDYSITTAETTIGCSDDNDIVIEDPTVSRHHAVLYFNGNHFGIRDLNSTNGVVMNGFKIDDLKLRNGDTVYLGKAMMKIYF